ncbi:MAG: hypothetical protein INR65_07605 [Gluconacetobacter diazotrophicus]|nr:hypothetical protein [Gluconacetobacter diazotrophicus]
MPFETNVLPVAAVEVVEAANVPLRSSNPLESDKVPSAAVKEPLRASVLPAAE